MHMELHQWPALEWRVKQENDVKHHHGDCTADYSGLLGGSGWKYSPSGESFKNFIYFSFISGHTPELVDKSVTLENRPRQQLGVSSQLNPEGGTAIPAQQLYLLVHGMYHSTCIGKYPTPLACPLVAKASLISREAVLQSGEGCVHLHF